MMASSLRSAPKAESPGRLAPIARQASWALTRKIAPALGRLHLTFTSDLGPRQPQSEGVNCWQSKKAASFTEKLLGWEVWKMPGLLTIVHQMIACAPFTNDGALPSAVSIVYSRQWPKVSDSLLYTAPIDTP